MMSIPSLKVIAFPRRLSGFVLIISLLLGSNAMEYANGSKSKTKGYSLSLPMIEINHGLNYATLREKLCHVRKSNKLKSSIQLPFVIEIDSKNQEIIFRKTTPTPSDSSSISLLDRMQHRFKTQTQLSSKAFKRMISKTTHFSITSATRRSLGVKLFPDCRSLFQRDKINKNSQSEPTFDQNFNCKEQTIFFGRGFQLVKHKTWNLSNSLVSRSRSRLETATMTSITEVGASNDKYSQKDAIEETLDESELMTTPKDGILSEEEREALILRTQTLTESVIHALENDDIWDQVNQKDGVTVWKTLVDVKNYHPIHNSNPTHDSDSATIRSETIFHASPKKVYDLFTDDSRANEFNENCHQLQDIIQISKNSKINWSATGKFGPFSARDFVTLVTFQNLGPQKGYRSLCASVEHPTLAPEKEGYVRSQIQLAATFMEPIQGKPNQTRFIQVMQVGRLGGVADTPLAKRIKNNLEIKAPVEFVQKFNAALKRVPPTSSPSMNETNEVVTQTTSGGEVEGATLERNKEFR